MAAAVLLNALLLSSLAPPAAGTTDWSNHGANILNHKSAKSRIGVQNVQRLQLRWKASVGGDVTATPAIAAREGIIYFPTWGGLLYAKEAETGRVQWQRNLTQVLGEPGLARATPALAGERLLLSLRLPPIVMAFNRSSGAALWSTPPLNSNPAAMVTMSGTVHEGYYYVGTSSKEEGVTSNCCYFQGSVLKIRVSDGRIVWRSSMLPDNGGRVGGYAGAAVWGSSPSIDKARGLLFVATGNDYQVPASVVERAERSQVANAQAGGFTPDSCLDANNHAESIVAIELESGRVAWSRHLGGYDVFSAICANSSTKPVQCASSLGPDYDFGQAPMLLHVRLAATPTERTCIVVAAQKSGFVWALDCGSGKTIWYTKAGSGSALGGSMWGSSTDGKFVYTGISNYYNLDFELKNTRDNLTNVTTGGGWVALDAATGEVKWAVANPAPGPSLEKNATRKAPTFGPVSTSPGIVWVTSYDNEGHVYAINSKDGSILWDYMTGATVYGGFSVGTSCVFVGNGYSRNVVLPGTRGGTLFAFCLP